MLMGSLLELSVWPGRPLPRIGLGSQKSFLCKVHRDFKKHGKLVKAGKLNHGRFRSAVLGLDSRIIVGGIETFETCKLENYNFTCDTLNWTFDALGGDDIILSAVDDDFDSC